MEIGRLKPGVCSRVSERKFACIPHDSRHVRTVRVKIHKDRVPHRGSNTQSGALRAWRLFAHSLWVVQTLPHTFAE